VQWIALLVALWAGGGIPTSGSRWSHEVTLDVDEVTFADVTVSPDRATLVFSLLGHLFRVPEVGGAAEQLTFGPSYDFDPVYSPDGARIAFVSDRDGTDGNVFVLDFVSGDLRRVSDERRTARPVWTPDGRGIVFLSIERDLGSPGNATGNLTARRSRIVRAWLDGRPGETLTEEAREFRSVFFLNDGTLAASEVGRRDVCPRMPGRAVRADRCYTSRIVPIDPGGAPLLADQEGILDRVVPGPTAGTFYARRPLPLTGYVPIGQPEHLVFGDFESGVRWLLTSVDVSGRGGTGRGHWSPRFGVSSDGQVPYFVDRGHLWRLDRRTGVREWIPFRARARVVAGERVTESAPRIPAAGDAFAPRAIAGAQLLPDRSGVVFAAGGAIWEQPLDGGPPRRLTDEPGPLLDPRVSPDGEWLAYIDHDALAVRHYASQPGVSRVTVRSLRGGEQRTLYEAGDLALADWSATSDRLLVNDWDRGALILSLDPDVPVEELPGVPNENELRFSPDGVGFVVSMEFAEGDEEWRPGMPAEVATVQHIPSGSDAGLERLTDYLPHLNFGRPSPDGRWLAFRRQLEIWVAPLSDRPVTEFDLRRLSAVGGTDFRFSPDGSAIVFSHGRTISIRPLDGGEPLDVPVRLELETPEPQPTVLRNVRVLDYELGRFTEPTTVVVSRGRIDALGEPAPHPDNARVIDAGGRFAIPGLWNAHTHDGPMSPGNLAYGITSVRQLGLQEIAAAGVFADWLQASGAPSPRFFYAGPTLGATVTNRRHPFVEQEEIVRAVKEWPDLGMGLLKAYAHLPWSWRRAIGPVAREAGVRVVSHGDDIEYIVRSVIDGFNGLEHGFSVHLYADAFQLMAESGIYWCPTLMAGGLPELALSEPERMEDPRAELFWGGEWRRVANADFPAAASRGVFEDALTKMSVAWERGVTMLVGTDRRFGPALHWEMEMFVRAGIPPIDVLQAATLNPARAVGAERDLGSIEVGKLADLVLLDADPLADITNTLRIWRVMKGGWLFDPDTLEAAARGS